jgi:hypothetical protein
MPTKAGGKAGGKAQVTSFRMSKIANQINHRKIKLLSDEEVGSLTSFELSTLPSSCLRR